MKNIYVISDIHGELEIFNKMLNKINFKKDDKLIILGDVLDRGKHPIKTLQLIMELKNVELIMGNHEKMFLDFMFTEDEFDKRTFYQMLVYNGGYSTLAEYDVLEASEQERILNYLKSLSYYKIIGNYILVHSGLNMSGIENYTDIKKIMEIQTEEDLLWSREQFFYKKAVEDYTTIFGHTPTPLIRNQTENYNFNIWRDKTYKDKIGIDCGATFENGKLACIRLNDEKVFYVKK